MSLKSSVSFSLLLVSCLCLQIACTPSDSPGGAKAQLPEPPMAKVVPHQLEKHGHVRTDNYYWLKEREDPEVKAYLEAENTYFKTVMQHTEPLQEKLYEEMVGRIKKDDDTVPYEKDGYYYYTRVVEGGEYLLYCRKKGSLEAEEEVMLDGNKMAEGRDFFYLDGLQVSPDQNLLAYAVDSQGRRIYTVHFKNLKTGETLADTLPQVTGNVAWANDNKTVFYGKQDPTTLRPYQVYRHVLGTDPADDVLMYEEKDETFRSFIFRSQSEKYVMIALMQTLSTEFRYLDAENPSGEFKVLLPRKRNHEYWPDHYGDHFYIRTNHEAKNFRLMKTPDTSTAIENWEEILPHRSDVLLSSFQLFKNHIVASERKDGLVEMRVMPLSGGEDHYVDFGEPAYLAFTSDNYEGDTEIVRYSYTSLTTPWSTFDYNMNTREKTLLKQTEVVGDFDPENYITERLGVPARDGQEIPASIVYKKGAAKDGSHPLLLYAYGSYGATIDPTFSSERLSLLERGFIYVIAHTRGGQVKGRYWYEDGKLLKKKNTFTDFIDVADYLVAQGYTRKDRLFAQGSSAGGLLVGAVYNMRPDLFHGVVAQVPFVDVITTMLDPDIPLTTGEYDEWGDPNKKDYYDYILSYSPYDNVEPREYPHLLVTTGFQDSQVQYWEPAKWVAKLRALKTGEKKVLLYTNMGAGHGGQSGRFRQHLDTARVYAFLLDLAGTEV